MVTRRYAPRFRHNSGFTLIELLAAVAVAGILASIGLTVFTGHAERAREQEAIAEIGQIQLAIAMYASRPGAPGGLPDALTDLGMPPALMTDPWGRPYLYVPLAASAAATVARTDGSDTPLNRDFDLFSLGRDGATDLSITAALGADDIVRGASGSFIGTAADFAALAGAATGGFTAPGAGSSPAAAAVTGGLDPRR